MAKKEKKGKIVSISDGSPQYSDAESIARIRDQMSPAHRMEYDDIEDGIRICKETGRLSVYPMLIKQRKDLLDQYTSGDDDRTSITWDDASLREAAGG